MSLHNSFYVGQVSSFNWFCFFFQDRRGRAGSFVLFTAGCVQLSFTRDKFIVTLLPVLRFSSFSFQHQQQQDAKIKSSRICYIEESVKQFPYRRPVRFVRMVTCACIGMCCHQFVKLCHGKQAPTEILSSDKIEHAIHVPLHEQTWVPLANLAHSGACT